jgi:hypothetical protein
MDPDYVYNLYKSALRDGDVEQAEEHMANLREWIRRGGFRPLGWV